MLEGDELDTLIGGLRRNGQLAWYSYLITGYIRSESFLMRVLDVVKQIRTVRPSMRYVCDPVLGDDGHLYVPKELVALYRDKVAPVATVMTPNQFELG